VRLRAEAHFKGCRGSTYEGHPSTRRGRTAGQVSPLQSDSGPRRADTNFTAPSPSQLPGWRPKNLPGIIGPLVDNERRMASSGPPRRYLRYGLEGISMPPTRHPKVNQLHHLTTSPGRQVTISVPRDYTGNTSCLLPSAETTTRENAHALATS
jgi:hypothetical protein